MGGKHKTEEEDYWGYLIETDRSPTPLFQQLLIGIAHYISKNVAPWDVKTLTPSKMAHFYRLVGGNYDSLFLESPNHSISFIYKSLGCYHTLQPTKDPFATPTIPALTNDGFVRWQTVQLLLEPEEHVPFLREAVKRFEIKNPMTGEFFPRFLPAEALPRKPDADMTRWHDFVGQKLLQQCDPAAVDGIPPENRPLTDAEAYMQSPPSTGHRASFGQSAPAPPANNTVRSHRAGLQAPPENVRRHSVPDRARGQPEPTQQRVFTPPPQKQHHSASHRYASPDTPGMAPGSATLPAEESYFTRPRARRHGSSSHGRSGSNGSPHVRSASNDRTDRPGSHSHSHSRSPPRIPAPPQQASRRPPLSSGDSGNRRHTYAPAPYGLETVHQHRLSSGSPEIGVSGRNYTMSPPFYAAAPPTSQSSGTRHASLAGPPPANILPGGIHAASPPQHTVPLAPQHMSQAAPHAAPHMSPVAPVPPSSSGSGAPLPAQPATIPAHLRTHPVQISPTAPAPVPIPIPGPPGPGRANHTTTLSAGSGPPSTSVPGVRPGSSSADAPLSAGAGPIPILPAPPHSATLPRPGAAKPFSPTGTPTSATSAGGMGGLRFASAPESAAARSSVDALRPTNGLGSPLGSPPGTNGHASERARRRTMDEVAREREREEMEFEMDRRRRHRDKDRERSARSRSRGREAGWEEVR